MHHKKNTTMRADLNSLPISRIMFDENLFGLNCEIQKQYHQNRNNKGTHLKSKLTSRQLETMVFGSRAAAIK